MALTYTTKKRDRKPVVVTFTVDGVTYTARKPKDALSAMVLAATSDQASTADIMHATFSWIHAALPAGDYAQLNARLRNYDDDFDIHQLLEITVDVITKFDQMESGEPFTPSGPDPVPPQPRPEPVPAPAGAVKRRGRPPGSKNKPKTDVIEGQVLTAVPSRVSRTLPK